MGEMSFSQLVCPTRAVADAAGKLSNVWAIVPTALRRKTVQGRAADAAAGDAVNAEAAPSNAPVAGQVLGDDVLDEDSSGVATVRRLQEDVTGIAS